MLELRADLRWLCLVSDRSTTALFALLPLEDEDSDNEGAEFDVTAGGTAGADELSTIEREEGLIPAVSTVIVTVVVTPSTGWICSCV